mmetsp:Transcript_19677/g.14127  ORF Transcript_19677/g.14127 Transcript_19677/m.14127 type:complete len:184 (-) Transcript_19677:199-750(-)
MPILLICGMAYFDNWTVGPWIYFCMHGTYGALWVIKDKIFPDRHLEGHATLLSWLFPFPIALIPYTWFGYLMVSGQASQYPSIERVAVCLLLYIFGELAMMVTHAQMYYTLRLKRGLITDGMMKYTRNPNYCGEVMIYSSFAILINRWEPWFVLSYMFGFIFIYRMMLKDYSLSKKLGWEQYR